MTAASAAVPTPPKTIVYIDGFNLYYGALKGTPHKWLNLERYFTLLRANDDLQVIKYFTAIVAGTARSDQETYIRALSTLPSVEIILGKFKNKKVRCSHSTCTYTGDRMFDAREEKRTDVNIAVSMLDDAYQDSCEQFVLVSGDSDLVPAIKTIRQRFPMKRTIVYVPHMGSRTRGYAVELRTAAHVNRDLPLNLLSRSQFPSAVHDGSGGVITKPSSW